MAENNTTKKLGIWLKVVVILFIFFILAVINLLPIIFKGSFTWTAALALDFVFIILVIVFIIFFVLRKKLFKPEEDIKEEKSYPESYLKDLAIQRFRDAGIEPCNITPSTTDEGQLGTEICAISCLDKWKRTPCIFLVRRAEPDKSSLIINPNDAVLNKARNMLAKRPIFQKEKVIVEESALTGIKRETHEPVEEKKEEEKKTDEEKKI